jgi:hypothetical protein
MAIQSFKEVIGNKGYRIDSKDRKIFEEGNLQSFFGFGENDVIEFIVYDSSDNQLPQKDGNLVRYIPLSTENISDYFMVPEGVLFEKNQLPKEYFIDAERLLREAGYNNGVFKTQITLLNFRLGNNLEPNKVWISEISPSRLEVRLLPIRNIDRRNDLLEDQFNIFVNGGEFRDDTNQLTSAFLENITPQKISSILIDKFGKKYFDTFLAEYKIQDFDTLVTRIYNKFLEAAKYEFSNKVSKINDINYGNPKPIKPSIKLSVSDIKRESLRILVEIIDSYLFRPEVKETTSFDVKTDDVVDIVEVVKGIEKIQSEPIQPKDKQRKEEIVEVEKEKKTDKQKQFEILLEKELGNDKAKKIKNTGLDVVETESKFAQLPLSDSETPKESGNEIVLSGGLANADRTMALSNLPNSKNIKLAGVTSVGELNQQKLVDVQPNIAINIDNTLKPTSVKVVTKTENNEEITNS